MGRRPNLFTMVLALLLLLPLAAAQAEVITFDHNGQQAGFELIQQSAQGVELKFRLEQVRLEDVEVEGTLYQQISIPGVFLPVQAGAPNLPAFGRMVALPNGAAAHLEVTGTKREKIKGIDVLPAAAIPWETDDSPPLYEPDPAIYGRDAYWPDEIVQFSDKKRMRGVEGVILGISPFQYNPARKELVVFSEIHVRLDFEGGNGKFGVDRLRSKDWDSILHQHLLNFNSLPALETLETDATTPEGEYEYVIIVPDDPVYITQAERLKQFRIEQGISTGVVTLTETGSTAADIEDWIDSAYNFWQTPPEAVLLLADWVSDGGTDGITCSVWNDYCPSDNLYADFDGDDLPDIVFARMTATPENVERLVSKVIDYELSPPINPDFYQNPLLACGWQLDRWFCLCSEIVHGFLENGLGKSPVREYAGGSSGLTTWSTNENTWMLLDYFGPIGLGYIPDTPAHLTDWSGDADGINSAINSGAFLTQHRDHGSVSGWSHPSYTISNLAGLANEDLTYVFSINCQTGWFDNASEVFAEAFHRMENGALGIVAATRNSYSFVNDTLVFGMWDYMWPEFDPGHGPSGAVDPRPAFALASAKYYLRDSVWPYNPTSKEVTYHLFHAHGGAYTTLYTEMPQVLALESDDALPVGSTGFQVRAEAGAMIALTLEGRILGVAEATGEWQELAIYPALEAGEAKLTVTKPNYYRYSAPIPVIYECTFTAVPSSLPIQQESEVQVTVWDDEGHLAPDMIVSIDGWGIDEVSGVTDGSGEVSLSVLPPYGENLVVRGKEADKTYHCFAADLPVEGGNDFASAVVEASVPALGIEGVWTPSYEGLLTGTVSETDFTMYARGCGVDESAGSGAGNTAELYATPTTVGWIQAVIGKPGFNLYEQSVEAKWVYGTLSGTVRNPESAPLEGVLVEVYPVGAVPGVDPFFAQTVTGPDGLYSIQKSIPAGPWEAHLSTAFGYENLHQSILILDGDNTIDFTMQYAPNGVLSGIVTDADSGEPLEASIQVFRYDNQSLYVTVTSDPATGEYETTLPYYQYRVLVETIPHYSQNVDITIDQPAMTLDFSLERAPAWFLIIDDTYPGSTTSNGAVLERELEALGYRADRECSDENDLDPTQWWKYSAMVWAVQDITNPEYRLALRNYLTAGGRVMISGAGLPDPAYEYWFAKDVIHGDDVTAGSDDLHLIAGSHPLATTPNQLGDMYLPNFFANDAIDPRPDAELVYEWEGDPGFASVLTWDIDPDLDHGNLVYLSFDYDSIESLDDRQDLLENMVRYLNNRDWQADVGGIAGTVTLEGETDFSNVLITTDPPTHSARTGADGSYTLQNVPPGTYSIIAFKNGFVSGQVSGVDVVVDETTTGIDFFLPIQYAEGLLSGTVTESISGDPVEAWIEIYGIDDPTLITTTMTDASGYYELQLLYGTYHVVAEGIHHFSNEVLVAIDQPGVNQDFELTESLGGILVIDGYTISLSILAPAVAMETSLLAAGYKPVVEHYSETDPSTWWDYAAVIWASGNSTYGFTDPVVRQALRDYLNGDGRLLIQSGNVASFASMNVEDEWFFSEVLHADYLGTSAGYLELRAESHVLATTPNNLGDIMPVDLTIDDDVVQPRSDAEMVYGWSDYAGQDASGVLVWDDDPDPDHGNLVFMSFDYKDVDWVERARLIENAAHYLVNRDVVGPELGDITGTALLDGETNHSGIAISTVPSSVTATTATDGSYELSNVPVGTYSVVATKDGWTDGQVNNVDVIADQTTSGIDFLLYAIGPDVGAISGTALLEGESDHSGISITTLPSSSTAATSADGSYELTNVPAGSYSVLASKDGWTDGQVDDVEVVADQTTPGIDFLLYEETTNLPPEAENQQVSTKVNKSVVIELEASDPDGDPLTYICVDLPSNGILSGCDDGDEYVTYSPDNQFTGNDTFTFKANDGLLDSNEATVTVKVAKGGGGGGGKPTDGVTTLQLNSRDGVKTLQFIPRVVE